MLHQAIEFGNRLLTFVVAAAAIASIVVVHKAQRRKELKVYAWAGLAGIVVQALIGALSVKLNLSWWAVAIHFLPSMVLVWIAAMLFSRINEPDDGTPTRLFPATVRTLAVVATVALSIVLLTGTFVTGSGTHSGDAGVGMEGRLGVDTYGMAIIHAVCMYIYLALTLIVVFLLHRTGAPKVAKKAGWCSLPASSYSGLSVSPSSICTSRAGPCLSTWACLRWLPRLRPCYGRMDCAASTPGMAPAPAQPSAVTRTSPPPTAK